MPPDTPIALVTSAEHTGRSCPYCRFPLKTGVQAVECGSCHAMHHGDCWQDNGGCAVMGCASAPGKMAPQVAAPSPMQAPATAFATAGVSPPPPPPPPVGAAIPRRIQPAPSPTELVQAARSWAQTPTVLAVVSAGLIAFAAMVAVGLLIAVVAPDRSLIGGVTSGVPFFKGFVRDTVATTQVRLGHMYSVLPITFALVPLLGSAVGVYRNASRTAGLSPWRRLLVGAATGVPLALVTLILSRLGGGDGLGFSSKAVVLYCLLWGAVGGLLGATRAVGPNAWGSALAGISAPVARWLRLVGTAARPLLTVLVITGVVGVFVWEVQSIRHQENALDFRPQATALVETPFFVGEYAIDDVALGTFTQFKLLGADSFFGPLPPDDNSHPNFGQHYRIFGYHGGYPTYAYVFLLILLIALPIAFAAYAGYATAVRAGATSFGPGLGYGATVGLVWALIMVILRTIANVQFIVGDSLFVSVLLVAGVSGALGGLLATVRPPQLPQA
jgi:hypothetical protein